MPIFSLKAELEASGLLSRMGLYLPIRDTWEL